ncbi:His Kinase A (phospho-acceptor) domain-containing protein [Dethiosulfovibrio salsuginis]|uniref:histidine kinase n=2 Tax=Dethiosulfovibrio salsuginis TaxID=561720 RepID=A0A1X7IIP5_9BACT|nr:His Kinase A (phospho-acceptor) domain-containing protein [Dethiosulfovibrio salsuginis]
MAVEGLYNLTGLPLGVIMAIDLVPRLTQDRVVVAGVPSICLKWHLDDPVRGELCRTGARELFTLDWEKGIFFSRCPMGFDTFSCPVLVKNRPEAIVFGHVFFMDKRPADDHILSLISRYEIDPYEYLSELKEVRVFSRQWIEKNLPWISKVVQAVIASGERVTGPDQRVTISDPSFSFIRKLSHEIRTPLAAIQIHAKRHIRKLEDRKPLDTPSLRRSLGDISDGATQIERLIEQLPEVGGGAQRSFRPLFIGAVCREAWRMVQVSRGLGSSEVSFSCDVPPNATVLGDGYDLFRLFVNLYVNSWNSIDRSGNPGSIRVTSQVEDYQVVVSVEDDGEGFPPGEGAPEERIKNRPLSGSGLGLAVVQAIVSDHRGKLELRDRAPVGATVTLHFPKIKGHL